MTTRDMKAQKLAERGGDMLQERWRVAIELLHTVQSDYQQARKQLERICSTFSDRENTASRQLRFALESTTQTKRQHRQAEVMCLRACCLGNFQVYVGHRQVEHWSSLKAKSVLKYLIAQHRRPVPKDVLMEALWEGCSPELANSNLKTAVYALRQSLSPLSNEGNNFSYIVYLEGNYLINPKLALLIDDEEFEHHWLAGQQLEKKGEFDEAMREYMMAESLYRGDYLEDDLYEEWTLMRREMLKDIYLNILSRLAEHSAQTVDYEKCIDYCQKILAKEPCYEEGYRQLMRSYSRLGQRNRALKWYRVCERTIRRELDITPEYQTVTLYHQLLNDEDI